MLAWHFFTHFIFSPRAGALIRRIAWLSIVSILLSVTSFLLVLFVMNGMNDSIQKRLLALEPHLYVTVPGIKTTSLLEAHPVYQRLRENPENKAYIFETQDLIIRTIDGQFRGAIARGVSAESLKFMTEQIHRLDRAHYEKTANQPYTFDAEEVPGEGELIMGVDLARSLGVFEGDTVTVVPPEALLLPLGETPLFEKVRVHKIISTNLSDIDAQYVFYQRGVALKSLQNSAGVQRGIEVFTPKGQGLEALKEDLMKFEGVQVETWMDRNSALFYALKLEKFSIGMFLGLAAIISASSILTVLTLLMSQKKRDIAILRTIGLSGRGAVKLFTQLGASLAGFGVIGGVILGTGLSLYIEFFPVNVLPDIYYDSQIPARVDFTLVLGVFVVSSIIALLGAWIPARAALEIEPSQALRVKN